MSKNVAVFVDVANLYYAARGQDVDVDYVALLKHATKGRDLIRAYAYSGLDPENENQKKFLDFLGKNGYRVVAKDIRKFGDGRVKANLDIELVVDLFRLADRMDVAVIVSGDGDFAPAIRALQDEGVRCEVISFKPNTSSDLFAVADEFHDVMKISAIGRQKDAKGVGAPEMPAKEVNPDVGFREASPSVAAAALAAARGNGDEPAGRGGGRGARRRDTTGTGGRRRSRASEPEPAAAAETAGTDPQAIAPRVNGDDDNGTAAGRRRRRRGGRGRGRRGRRGDLPETVEAGTSGEPAEIQWEEIDSLDELDGGAVRPAPDADFTFEEADAATLAELGLTEASAAPAAADAREPVAEEAAKPAVKPRSRARSTTTKAATAKDGSAKAGTASVAGKTTARKPARSGAGAKPAAKPASKPTAAKSAKTDETPKAPRTRTARAKGSAAPTAEPAAGDGASDQGIWQRFTSGRGTGKRPVKEPPETA